MNQRPLGRTGFEVSELGFGGAPVAYLKTDADRSAAMLNSMLDQGLSLIDTATSYPGSQAFIGEYVSHRRDEYTLVSKVGAKFRDVDAPDWSPAVISAAVDNALKELKTDVVDVMLLHTCDIAVLQNGEAIQALAKARDAGKIRYLGYSGDNDAAAYAAALPDVAVIETSINIADQINIDKVLPVAQRHNVGVIVKRPVANAAWKAFEQQEGMYANYASIYHDRLKKMNITPADLGFSGDPAGAWPGIALRFTLSLPGVASALVGTTKPANAQANIDAVAQGPLPESVVRQLRDAFKTSRSGRHMDWSDLTLAGLVIIRRRS